jgi:hypothetical protein
VAKEAGDLLLLGNDLRDVVTAIGLSQATMTKIRQNLFWAFIYNGLGVPIAAIGWLNPMLAGAAMALSSLSVIVKSSLLRNYRRAKVWTKRGCCVPCSGMELLMQLRGDAIQIGSSKYQANHQNTK